MAENSPKAECDCGAAPTLIFACSGAADVGHVADLAARRLAAEGAGKMFCLAGVGGRVSGILATTRAAAAILAIDGCPLDCARKTLEEAGVTTFEHVELSTLGMAKGSTPAIEETVALVARRGAELLAGSCASG